MKPIAFNGSNVVFARNQPPYLPLPANLDEDGKVTTCWQLTWRERFQVMYSGLVYSQLLTFGKPMQPQKLLTINPKA